MLPRLEHTSLHSGKPAVPPYMDDGGNGGGGGGTVSGRLKNATIL